MKKSIIAIIIFTFLFVTLLGVAPVFGEDEAPVITKTYGDYTSPLTKKLIDQEGENWDITRGDLKVSYTLDLSNYKTKAEGTTAVSQVGIWQSIGGFKSNIAWMSTLCPEPYVFNSEYDPTASSRVFNRNDKFCLGQILKTPTSETGYNDYITSGVFGDWANSKNEAIGKNVNENQTYGFYFDRDGATDDMAKNSGFLDGQTVNTKGIYNVVITYHAIDSGTGIMYATVNGVQQGFFGANPVTGAPQYMPVGRRYSINQKWAQLSVSLNSDSNNKPDAVKLYKLTVTGCPRAPELSYLNPNGAEQGDVLDDYVYGSSFRNDTNISVDFRKTNATNDGDTTEMFSANKQAEAVIWKSNNKLLLDSLAIPDQATPGAWNVTYAHADDPSKVARLNNAFTVALAPPKPESVSVKYARRGQTVKMYINGRFFRKVDTTVVQLGRKGDRINASRVVWIKNNQLYAEIYIPSTAKIAADWHLIVKHSDDEREGILYYAFSIEPKVTITPVLIWLRCPGFTTVNIYSESGFDATDIMPLTVNLGGTLEFWRTSTDLNRDGKKDLQLHYYNGFVTIPVGFLTPVAVSGATSTWVPVRGHATVTCFWFLF